ncbi:MAG: DUF1549 and DUF1553 domain-containing protein [Planctomycetota bacterium]|jgi:hypothetical protein|nr:DUF1549 and DUF1553 domain-containing protein [Planctomycetota bacterium]
MKASKIPSLSLGDRCDYNRDLLGPSYHFPAIMIKASMNTHFGAGICAGFLIFVSAIGVTCSFGADPSSEYVPKFELDIQPILTARGCNSGPCHGKSRGQNGFSLSLFGFDSNMDFDALIKNARGRRVSIAAPTDSLLLTKATGKEPHGGGIRLREEDQDYATLIQWIKTGLQRTTASDPTLAGIRFEPDPRNLSTNEDAEVRVLATYSDGVERDVTGVSSFQSSDPGIVSVKSGTLRSGPYAGEATIMARYMGRIATWSTAVLKAKSIPVTAFDEIPRNNWIDDLVIDKLKSLDVMPSELSTETVFLRRLFLDAIGRLPTPEEVAEFLADERSDRRVRWIDRVLDQPEYADFWANKWADLLRPNPYRVGIKATYSLDHWLRQSFRKNLPHDQFVRELLTAQGSTWRNGATTFFRDRREPDEITTVVSQLFLGVRLECAKCHQHPFEVYGQSDFYGLASYFAKIGHKGVGLSPPISGGEEIFFVKDKGEVKHPLTQQTLAPKPLTGPSPAIPDGTDPRIALVDWLLSPENPYFEKAAVNRLWAEVMGLGIVDPVDDFRATNPPSNVPLLNRLADHYRSVGFDNKQMLKVIFSSRTYQLSSLPNASNAHDSRNFSRHQRRRMRAEVMSDALSDATGVPTTFSGVPYGTRAVQLWTYRVDSELLDAFSRPDANQDPPCERTSDTTMSQSLHLMNSSQIQARLTAEDSNCARWAADSPSEVVLRKIYFQIYSRAPSDDEIKTLLAEQKHQPDRRRWVEDIVWAMINSPEFTFID